MFGTLRRISSLVVGVVNNLRSVGAARPQIQPRYNGPALPIRNLLGVDIHPTHPDAIYRHSYHCVNGKPKRKTKGQRDQSLQLRASRRKAAR